MVIFHFGAQPADGRVYSAEEGEDGEEQDDKHESHTSEFYPSAAMHPALESNEAEVDQIWT